MTEGIDADVRRLIDLEDRIALLQHAAGEIKERLRLVGLGEHKALEGRVLIKVSPPLRRFNADKAAELLPETVRDQCKRIVWDNAKIKSLLPPALVDQVMEPGSGKARLMIKIMNGDDHD